MKGLGFINEPDSAANIMRYGLMDGLPRLVFNEPADIENPMTRYGLLNGYTPFVADSFLANGGKVENPAIMHGYDPTRPGTGFGAMAGKKLMSTFKVPVKEDSPPGWPGFFAWVAATHPRLYDDLRVALPNLVEDRQGFSSPGPHPLGAYLGAYENNSPADNRKYLGSYASRPKRRTVNRQPTGTGAYLGAYLGAVPRRASGGVNAQPRGLGWMGDYPRQPGQVMFRSEDEFAPPVSPGQLLMNGLGDVPALPPTVDQLFNFASKSPVDVGASSTQAASEGITDYVPQQTTVATNQYASIIANIAKTALPLIQQQQIFSAQLSRAKAGLQPLNTAGLLDNQGFNFGLNPSTQKTLLMVAGLGVGAVLLVKLLKKR